MKLWSRTHTIACCLAAATSAVVALPLAVPEGVRPLGRSIGMVVGEPYLPTKCFVWGRVIVCERLRPVEGDRAWVFSRRSSGSRSLDGGACEANADRVPSRT